MRNSGTTFMGLSALLFSIIGVSVGQNPVYESHAKPHRAEVSVLATGVFFHAGFAGSQEIYLAEVSSKGGDHQLAKLIDAYPSIQSPILRTVLLDRHLLRMTLRRDPECDTTGSAFVLGRDVDIFDRNTPSLLKEHANDTIPCFLVDHERTRVAK